MEKFPRSSLKEKHLGNAQNPPRGKLEKNICHCVTAVYLTSDICSAMSSLITPTVHSEDGLWIETEILEILVVLK